MFENLDAGGEIHRYAAIKETAKEYHVIELCKLFGVSRSGYYAFLKRKDVDRDEESKSKALIKKVYEQRCLRLLSNPAVHAAGS